MFPFNGREITVSMRYAYPAAVLFLLVVMCGCGEDDSRPNVIVIIIDTLRADHLGCYGYGRETSPSVDSLAAEGIRWEYPTAQANWTLPAIASIYP
ncbi:MAG: sulfatase-like hydrolase/transferase, partial [Candidatus Aegiribacteria sp.]|nr:sulfatase-like hydrolase/transferase [Candidatus Aegiribacteria sp.]MBD3294147.1 sulfatase-like hydrolase/transferase [Candidatus Fermentibacteria bacterium]